MASEASVSFDDPTSEAEIAHDEPDRATLARALRELEAARARVERDARSVHDQTRANLVIELLPVLDNLDRTIESAEQHGDAPAALEGARLVRNQLGALLQRFGGARVDATGTRFDPKVHEAISVTAVQDPRHHGIVISQLQPGYRFEDRMLRPAKVVVGRYDQRYH
jgi:molecular chaperone GrpE